ncbi:ricin-type beta-trefoil lectin domain protein [Streptomyces sp. NPDC058092]|uniref:ricin-type beta-trefoil lectin domain protein n=1 Tax=Streptomyces sp. NPDC058092 TaxID=3346336 RepID=UPI0036E482A6
MTRSSQQPPALPRARAESGSEGEETAATAATATLGEPKSEPVQAKTGAEAGTEAGEAEKKPGEGRTTESEAGAPSGARSESEADPGATAAVQSRLPALVRTVTVTAIDRPQQRTGPVGRPGRAALAGGAVTGALLVSVPFLVLAGNDDKDPEQPTVAAGTVLDGSAQEAPGEFAVAPPETGSPGDGKKDAGKPGAPGRQAPASAPTREGRQAPASAPTRDSGKGAPQKDAGLADRPKKQSAEEASGDEVNQPAKAGSGVTLGAPVSLRSHLSGRCIDVPGRDFSDGKKLNVWDCNNSDAQKWQFASDGTIRMKDKCLDVANANFNDGTPIQIAWCNGNAAQKFVLNASHDLVNTVVGKCVDIKDNNRGNGAWLQLWSCAGTDNQKWSV